MWSLSKYREGISANNLEEAKQKLATLLEDLKESIQDLKAEDFLPPSIWLPRKKSYVVDEENDLQKNVFKKETKFYKNKLSVLISFDHFENWEIDPNEIGAYLDFSESESHSESEEESGNEEKEEKKEKKGDLVFDEQNFHYFFVNNNFGSDDLTSEVRTTLKVREDYLDLIHYIDTLVGEFSYSQLAQKFGKIKSLDKILNVLLHTGMINLKK